MDTLSRSTHVSLLTFVTTYECEACCSHCLMSCSPKRHEKLSFQQMREVIDKVYFDAGLSEGVVVFTGGECTRLGEDLFEAIAYANVNGLATRIVTNAEWAHSDAEAISMIKKLREAGLDEFNISFDDFHAEWVPVDNVVRAWKATKGQGFVSVSLAAGSGPRSVLNPYTAMELFGESLPLVRSNCPNKELPEPSEDGTIYMISNTTYSRIGRGRHIDSEVCAFPDQDLIFSCPCSTSDQQIVISPALEVGICCGLDPQGNELINHGRFDTFKGLDEWRALFLQAVGTMGPGYLIQLIEELDPSIEIRRSRYASTCEMCEDIARSKEGLKLLHDNRSRIANDLAANEFISSLFM